MAVRRIKFIKRREVYIMRLHDGYQSNSSKEKQAVCDSCHEIGGAFAENKRPYFIIDQVGRSGTSIGANVMEAEHAITQKEFLQKMYIAYKESNETLYWLELLFESGYVAPEGYQRLYTECNEIEKMLSAITKTMAEKIKRSGAL